MKERSSIKRLEKEAEDGSSTYSYKTKRTNVPCLLDLSFMRPGKDTGWTQDPGRSPDRTGVIFYPRGTDIRAEDHIEMTFGRHKSLKLQVTTIPDAVGSPRGTSHIEAGVTEVAQSTST